MRMFARICLFHAVLCSPILALNPYQSLGQLHHTTWGPKEGLNGAVRALAQTADGFLWVGTTDGLYRFDGVYFERYTPEQSHLLASSVSSLLALPSGGLWIGYDRGGASFLKDGEVTNYSIEQGFPVSRVRCFAQDAEGAIWAGAVGGFVRLEGHRWQRIRENWNYPSKSAWRMGVDRLGTLWVATGERIVFLPKGERKFRDAGFQTIHVTALAQAPDGTLFFYNNALDY